MLYKEQRKRIPFNVCEKLPKEKMAKKMPKRDENKTENLVGKKLRFQKVE